MNPVEVRFPFLGSIGGLFIWLINCIRSLDSLEKGTVLYLVWSLQGQGHWFARWPRPCLVEMSVGVSPWFRKHRTRNRSGGNFQHIADLYEYFRYNHFWLIEILSKKLMRPELDRTTQYNSGLLSRPWSLKKMTMCRIICRNITIYQSYCCLLKFWMSICTGVTIL